MFNSIRAWNGRTIVGFMCLNVAFTSYLWKDIRAKVDKGILVFGNTTNVKSGRVFVTVSDADGGTLDVTCALPVSNLYNRTPYFQLDYKQIYNGNRSEVTVLNKTTTRLLMTFYSPRPRSYLQCKPNGQSVDLYVNRGLESARQHANCSMRLPPVNASSLNASLSLVCDLTIIFGINESYFDYNVTIGTSSADEEMVVSETAQGMPIRLSYGKLTLANVLNSSMLFIRTSLAEQFSGRNTMLYTEVAIVYTLQPPLEVLSWDPLNNGTGIRVFLNLSYLNQKCGVWKYHADIRLDDVNSSHTDSTSWHMRCTLCNTTCQTILYGLRPATTYSVTLWQRIVMSDNQSADNRQNTDQLPAHHLIVSTAELGFTPTSPLTSDHIKGISMPVIASILAAAGVIPIALTVVCIKFAQYRKAWKSTRLRILRIAPSRSSLKGKGQEQDARSSYVKLSAVSSEDLSKLALSSSDCTEIPDRLKPSSDHRVRRSLSYTNFLNQHTSYLDASEGCDATNLMDGGRHWLANRSHGTRSAEQLIHYLTNVSDYSFGACATKCISPLSLRKLMVASKNESDTTYLSSDWFETSNGSSAVFPSYPPRGESHSHSLSLLDKMCELHVVTTSHRQASLSSNESTTCSANSSHIARSRSLSHLTEHDGKIERQSREKVQDSVNFLTDSSGDYIRSSVLSYAHAKRDTVTTFTKLSPESDYILAI